MVCRTDAGRDLLVLAREHEILARTVASIISPPAVQSEEIEILSAENTYRDPLDGF
jgi:hypothetical protein